MGGLDPNTHTPTVQQWTLEIERAITPDLALQLGYVGHSPISGSVVFNTSDLTKYSGSAGAITETANRERQIQFALRLEF